MLDLNKYSNLDKSRVLHTSGYAREARGDQMGSTGGRTFNQRLEAINRENKVVSGYRSSAIGSRHGSLRAKQATLESTRVQRSISVPDKPDASALIKPTQTASPRGFVEPPRRTYNPFS